MLRFAVPVYFANVVNTLGTNLQIMMLAAFGTLAAVGIFAVAEQVNLIATLFHSSIVAAAMPLIARLQDRGDRAGLAALYRTTSLWTFALGLPLFLVVVLVPGELLSVFGSQYATGAAVLVLLGFAALVNAATGTSGAMLDMTGHTRVKFVNATLSVGLALGAGVLLVPSMGMVGAAVAVLIATVAVNAARIVEVALLVRLSPYDRSYLKPLAAGAAALVVGLGVVAVTASVPPLLRAGLVTASLVAAYLVVLYRLGLSDADRDLLRAARDRLLRRPMRVAEAADAR